MGPHTRAPLCKSTWDDMDKVTTVTKHSQTPKMKLKYRCNNVVHDVNGAGSSAEFNFDFHF